MNDNNNNRKDQLNSFYVVLNIFYSLIEIKNLILNHR